MTWSPSLIPSPGSQADGSAVPSVSMRSSFPDIESPPRLRIVLSRPGEDTMVVTPAGEADICTAGDLRRALTEAVDADCPRVIVDLDHLTFMDASTLGVLVGAHRRSSATGKSLQVRCSDRLGLWLLEITGLEGLLDRSTQVVLDG